MLIDLAFGEDTKIVKKLQKVPCVKEAYRLIGEWDAIVILESKDVNECIKKIKKMDGVGQNIVLKAVDIGE